VESLEPDVEMTEGISPLIPIQVTQPKSISTFIPENACHSHDEREGKHKHHEGKPRAKHMMVLRSNCRRAGCC
jgi:hypothetical protein